MLAKNMKIPASYKGHEIIFVPKEEMSIDELKHYGVLGMKWGVRKAREYAKDVHQVRRNKAVDKARKKYKMGDISKEEFKKRKKQANTQQKRENEKVKKELSKVKVDKSKKVSSIYQPYQRQAYKEINRYGIKRFLYKARSYIRRTSAVIAVGSGVAASVAAASIGGAAFIPAYAGATLYGLASLGINKAIIETASKKLRHL